VPIEEKYIDSIFDLGCISMVVCGSKRVKVHNDHEKVFFRILHGNGNFDIIVKF